MLKDFYVFIYTICVLLLHRVTNLCLSFRHFYIFTARHKITDFETADIALVELARRPKSN